MLDTPAKLEEKTEEKSKRKKGENIYLKFIKEKPFLRNIILMTCNWLFATYTYYMLYYFAKYLPGDIYANQTVSNISNVIYLISGPLTNKFGPKNTLAISFLISIPPTISLLFFSAHTE